MQKQVKHTTEKRTDDIAQQIDGQTEDDRNEILTAAISEELLRYKGPLPSPKHFEAYENVLPGSADRILKMAEAEQQERHNNNRRMIEAQISEFKKGQIIGAILVLLLIVVGGVLGFYGHDVLAGIVLTAMVSVAIVFVLRLNPKSKNNGK